MANERLNKHSWRIYTLFSPFLLITSLLFAFSGCLSSKAPMINFSSPEDALKKITSKAPLKGTLKAIARIEIITTQGRYPMRAAMMLKRPSLLRVETIPVIGPPDFFLSIRENVLKVFLPERGEFYIGQATTKNLSSFFPVSLQAEEMLSILTGTSPLPLFDERNQILRGILEGKLYRIDVMSENKRIQSLWIDPADNHLVRVDISADHGNIFCSARFEDFSKVENVDIPKKVIITTGEADNKSSITIRYYDIQLLTETDTEGFDLPIPAGVKLIRMD